MLDGESWRGWRFRTLVGMLELTTTHPLYTALLLFRTLVGMLELCGESSDVRTHVIGFEPS